MLNKKYSNKKLLAVAMAGVVAAGIILAAPVYALTDGTNSTNDATERSSNNTGTSSQHPMTHMDLHGSLKISSILDQIISKSGVTFADASSKAASAANGNTIGGRLGIVQGYLVYDMKVLGDDGMHRVIIDAGNGNTLFVSPAHQFGDENLFGSGEQHGEKEFG